MDAKDDISDLMKTLWSDRRDDVDSYVKWADASATERQKLYEEIFDKDTMLFYMVMDKLLPNTKCKSVKIEKRSVNMPSEPYTIPKICNKFCLSVVNNENHIIFQKVYSSKEIEKHKEVPQARQTRFKSRKAEKRVKHQKKLDNQKKIEKEKRRLLEEEHKRAQEQRFIEEQRKLETKRKLKEQQRLQQEMIVENHNLKENTRPANETKPRKKTKEEKLRENLLYIEKKLEGLPRLDIEMTPAKNLKLQRLLLNKMIIENKLKEKTISANQFDLGKKKVAQEKKPQPKDKKLHGTNCKPNENCKPSKPKTRIVKPGQPISSDNKGYLLLQKMGWSEGGKIGINNDKEVVEPFLNITKRAGKRGLGA